MKHLQILLSLIVFLVTTVHSYCQNDPPYTASFVGKLGSDTILVETYTMINNHLYGKAFVRVPEDYIGEFSIHFYPDGSIREFNVNAMNPTNSSIPFEAKSGAYEYRLNMNCAKDTCWFFNSETGKPTETLFEHPATKMDFVGGWVPFISLMEWNSIRLVKSGQEKLPLKMINHNLGVFDIGVQFADKDTILFGGPFLEYTRLKVDQSGRIENTNGIGTPWNYIVTKHPPIDIELLARRMTKTPGIGIPSPTETITCEIQSTEFRITYGRPYKRDRVIFGGVVPYDSLWRTGANGPTTISLESNIQIGNRIVPKGSYSIYTIPNPTNWLVIFSSDLTSWPTDPDSTKEFAQFSIPVKQATSISQQFTIEIKEKNEGGQISFAWDDVITTLDFEIIKQP